ncbi:hypothetical protein GCM10020255_078170 [Rhodococcus baikonurensis]
MGTVSAAFGNFVDHRPRRGPVQMHDFRAGIAEPDRERATDPASGSGDRGDQPSKLKAEIPTGTS